MGALVIAPVAAQDGEPGLESLGDPLEIERYVDTNGDDAVVEALTNEDARLESRLGAIRAAPWLTGPERALGPLARLAAGDDPDLAPAAGRAGQRCAEAIAVDGLTAREEDPAILGEAAAEWQAVADDETARPDVRAVAAATAQALSI
ncbi:MAG: hypothetical protein CMN30_21585 [Sandaracinus sp.]|nr:hypothetical protein [Sandaracinus sp.]